MKKSVYILLIIPLLFTACAKDAPDSGSFDDFMEEWGLSVYSLNVCTSVQDAVKYPEPWTAEVAATFVIPDETVHSMSTCGLLETLLEHPTNRMLGPWCTICSSLSYPGVTNFNQVLQGNKVAIELFKRSDCASVLASKYLDFIKNKKEISGQIKYFEMLLSSDMCMGTLSETEKIQLIAMALERTKYDEERVNETCHIMIAIMQSCDYAPFCEEVSPKLQETTFGYTLSEDAYSNLVGSYTDLIIRYAKQFLNDLKL